MKFLFVLVLICLLVPAFIGFIFTTLFGIWGLIPAAVCGYLCGYYGSKFLFGE
jgi:hypothetical protein